MRRAQLRVKSGAYLSRMWRQPRLPLFALIAFLATCGLARAGLHFITSSAFVIRLAN